MSMLLLFVPVAAVLSLTPGATTALIVRNAARGGRRQAFLTTVGNSAGVLTWGILAAVGAAAVVATSTELFSAVKFAGAIVLIAMGALSLRECRGVPAEACDAGAPRRSDRTALRDGVLTSLANPKLAVFFVALFPQFVPRGAPVLPAALAMVATIVAFDLVWYSALAWAVCRAKEAFVRGPWGRRVERLTGAVLVGLGVRLAFERR
jgi:threonine/homoserine/homoserine lactone efflux protein